MKTVDYKAKMKEIIDLIWLDSEAGFYNGDKIHDQYVMDMIKSVVASTIHGLKTGDKSIEQLPSKRVNVVAYLSEGGVVSGADADSENVAFEVFDCQDKAAEGLDSGKIQEEWEKVKKHYPVAIY